MIYSYDPIENQLIATENNAEECLRSIHYFAIDYDNAKTVEDFRLLVDEIDSLAVNALEFLFTNKIFIEDTEDEDHDTYLIANELLRIKGGNRK